MASFGSSELDLTTDEKWDMDLEEARYEASTIMQRVTNRSAIVKKSGDIINVTIQGRYSVNDVGASGSFTPQIQTLTAVQITVDKHKEVAIETQDKAIAQSFWDPESTFPKEAGMAMGEDVDTRLAELHTDFTSNVVFSESDPKPFDTVALRVAMLKLRDRSIPLRDLSFILPPIAYYQGILTETQLVDSDKTGLPKSVLINGFRTRLLEVPAYETTLLTTPDGTSAIKAFLLHKTAMAIATQKNNEIKRAERTSALVFSAVVAVQSLYGVKTIREDHGVVLNIKNS